ncbi:MAG: serine hydrolase [bacterium]
MDFHGDGEAFDSSDFYYGHDQASGSLITTAADLARFLEALAAGSLVSADSLSRMQDWTAIGRERDDGRNDYGLGLLRWETDRGEAFGHNGSLMGYLSEAVHFPETGATYVFLANGSDGKSDAALATKVKPAIPALLHGG